MTVYSTTKKGLLLSLAGAVTFVFSSGFEPISLGVLILVILAFAYWLLSHPQELAAEYSSTENNAAIPGKYDKQIWGNKPMVRDMAPGLLVVGISCYYLAISSVSEVPTEGLRKIVYQLFGSSGVVALFSLIGSICLMRGVELMLGNRLKK
jgi:hypothetical protein